MQHSNTLSNNSINSKNNKSSKSILNKDSSNNSGSDSEDDSWRKKKEIDGINRINGEIRERKVNILWLLCRINYRKKIDFQYESHFSFFVDELNIF